MRRGRALVFVCLFGGGCVIDESGLGVSDASIDSGAPDVNIDAADADLEAASDAAPADASSDADANVAPADPGSLGAVPAVWLRDDIVTDEGGTINAWVDQSGHDAGVDMVTAGPTLNSSDTMFAGHPSISFPDGTQLTNPSFAISLQPITVFLVGFAGSNPGLYSIFLDTTTTGAGRIGVFAHGTSGAVTLYTGQSNTLASSSQSAFNATVIVAIFNGAASSIYVASNTPKPLSLDAQSHILGLSVGGNAGAGLRGRLAELAIWPSALPSSDVARLNAYAATTYGIAVAP